MKRLATALSMLAVIILVSLAVSYAGEYTVDPIYTITHDPDYQEVAVGDTFHINVVYHANAADTTSFSRMAVDYDSLVVRCIAIENGADAPAYSLPPFINWGPVCYKDPAKANPYTYATEEWKRHEVFVEACPNPGYGQYITQHVYLGQFYNVGGPEIPWSGHAITYTFVAVGDGTTRVGYVEYGLRMNYVDMQPFVCRSGYFAEYTSDAQGLGTCIGLLTLPQTTTVVVGTGNAVGVAAKTWSNMKGMYR